MTGYVENRAILIGTKGWDYEAVNMTYTRICRTCVSAKCRYVNHYTGHLAMA